VIMYFSKRFFALLLLLLTSHVCAEEIKMATKPTFEYNMTIEAENMLLRLYINGAPIVYHGRTSKMLFTYPMTEYLRTGVNRIDVDYEPINEATRSYSAHAGVALQIEIRQLQGADFIGEAHLFSGRYNIEAKQILANETLVFGGTPILRQGGNMSSSVFFTSLPVDMNFATRKSGAEARRISFEFNIEDPTLLEPSWVNAPVLLDTPEMRTALWRGYKDLHDIVARRSIEGYLEIMEPILTRGAYILGYKNNADLAKKIFEFSPLGGPDGATLGPLMNEEAFLTASLRWASDDRMVGVIDDPISFFDISGNKIGAYRVLFCQQSNGTFRVCHQMDIPY